MVSPSNHARIRKISRNFKPRAFSCSGNRAEEEMPGHLATRKTIRRHPYSRSTYGRPREQVKGSLEYAERAGRDDGSAYFGTTFSRCQPSSVNGAGPFAPIRWETIVRLLRYRVHVFCDNVFAQLRGFGS